MRIKIPQFSPPVFIGCNRCCGKYQRRPNRCQTKPHQQIEVATHSAAPPRLEALFMCGQFVFVERIARATGARVAAQHNPCWWVRFNLCFLRLISFPPRFGFLVGKLLRDRGKPDNQRLPNHCAANKSEFLCCFGVHGFSPLTQVICIHVES